MPGWSLRFIRALMHCRCHHTLFPSGCAAIMQKSRQLRPNRTPTWPRWPFARFVVVALHDWSSAMAQRRRAPVLPRDLLLLRSERNQNIPQRRPSSTEPRIVEMEARLGGGCAPRARLGPRVTPREGGTRASTPLKAGVSFFSDYFDFFSILSFDAKDLDF